MSAGGSGYGKTVIDGLVQYWSATSLATGDHQEPGGCEHRWAQRYLYGYKEPETAAKNGGVKTHGELEEYLPTGRMVLGPVALSMVPYLPKPGPDLLVEGQIWRIPALPWLEIDGVPVLGKIDLEHERPFNVGGPDIEDTVNPPGTVEVSDAKTTSDFQWAKTRDALIKTVQMPLYGEAVARRRAREGREPAFIRLSHVIGRTKGARAARKVSKVHSRDEIRQEFEGRIVPLARRLAQVAAGDTPRGNTLACGAFRGCPFRFGDGERPPCPHYQTDSIGDLIEAIASVGEKEETMSVLDILNPAATAAPSAADRRAALAAEMAKLEAEEAAAQAKKNAAPAVQIPTEFLNAIDVIARAKMPAERGGGPVGMPPLAGAAAEIWATIAGHIVPPGGTTYPGTFNAARVPVRNTVQDVIDFATDLVKKGLSTIEAPARDTIAPAANSTAGAVQASPDAPMLLPPDAPTSKPELAADPVPGFGGVPAGTLTDAAPVQISGTINGMSGDGPEITAAPEQKPKGKGGRPKKVKPEPGVQTAPGEALEIFVNAIPNRPFDTLDEYVRSLMAALCAKFGLSDVRLATGENPLAFSRWRGAVASSARQTPPPKGTYVALLPDEITEIVLEVLRESADEYVRGVR